jgi:hypothetical protein
MDDGSREESAAALELALEGLHLTRRLNKAAAGGAARYRGKDAGVG